MDQKKLEAEVEAFARDLLRRHREARAGERPEAERAAAEPQSPWPVVRALLHRAVHLAAAEKGLEYCTVATYLAELVGHAHGLMHASDPGSASHRDHLH